MAFRRLLLTICLTLFCAAWASAQEGLETTVSGQFVDSQRSPLPGVTLLFRPTSLLPMVTAVTRADGRFQVTLSSERTYRAIAKLPGFKWIIRDGVRFTSPSAEWNATLEIGGTCECITEVDPRSLGRLTGVVRDRNGGPLPSAAVTLDAAVTTFAASDGRFELPDVAPGAHAVAVTFPGFLKDVRAVSVFVDQATEIDVRLEINPAPTAGVVSGFLYGSGDGAAFASARITISGSSLPTPVTVSIDPRGHYELRDVPEGLVRIDVDIPRLPHTTTEWIPVVSGERSIRDIALLPPPSNRN